ncbi:MAG: hypothetical protein COC19_03465 [SAR86 cluster bacterium]|uniref:Uncharacterized protein n=1 Tax=SAR86 cluster bacterium TaxID=2030880 RepID=A0A2A4MPL0_9GAMM|nr:MAG: hypothetical protein COC19_03465 [SAR86 cluster bacterium]
MRDDGDTTGALQEAAQLGSAEFSVPMLAHLTMEPMNYTAHYKSDAANGDSLELWISNHMTLAMK